MADSFLGNVLFLSLVVVIIIGAAMVARKNNVNSTMTATRPELSVLGVRMTLWSSTAQFLACAGGVCLCYLTYGILQEQITSSWKRSVAGPVHLGWFLTFFQCAAYCAFGFLQLASEPTQKSKLDDDRVLMKRKPMPLHGFFIIGTLSLLTIGLSNVSIEYLSYPTQVLFKSSKPLAVMLLGIFIIRKRYRLIEYVSTAMFTFGLMSFSVADKSASASSQPIGVIIICSALIVDGVIGNVQQKMFEKYSCSVTNMVCKSKAVAAGWAFLICIATGQAGEAITFTMQEPATLLRMVIYSIVGYVGESLVMGLILRFGALIAVMTTSFRKLLTILVSFMLFPKPWVLGHAVGVLMVFVGIFLNIFSKNEKKIRTIFLKWFATRSYDKKKRDDGGFNSRVIIAV